MFDNRRSWGCKSSGRRCGSASIPHPTGSGSGTLVRRDCKTITTLLHPAPGFPRWPNRRCRSESAPAAYCKCFVDYRRRPVTFAAGLTLNQAGQQLPVRISHSITSVHTARPALCTNARAGPLFFPGSRQYTQRHGRRCIPRPRFTEISIGERGFSGICGAMEAIPPLAAPHAGHMARQIFKKSLRLDLRHG